MKYHPPFGSTDPDASYVDRNTPGAVRGSAVPAAAIEVPQREIVNVIAKSGIDPADGNQLASAIQSGLLNYTVAGGTADALTASLPIAPATLFAGLVVRIKITATNTISPTLNLNGLGAVNILKGDGSPLTSGYLAAGEIVTLTYDGSAFRLDNAVRRRGDTITSPASAVPALSLVSSPAHSAPALDITYSGSPFRAYISESGMIIGARSPADRSQYFYAGPGGLRGANYMTEDASPVWTTEVYDTAGNPTGTKGFLTLRGGPAGSASFGVNLGGNHIANFASTSLGLRFGGNQSITLSASSGSISCDGTGIGSNAAGFSATRPATTAGSAPYAYVAAGSLRFYVDEGGGLHSTSGSIAVISDEYFKENVADLPTALENINALRPVTYRLKDDDKTRATRVGFIAQEVQQVMPLLVTEDDKIDAGGRSALTLNMGDLVPYLIKSVQELSARVVELEAKLAEN